MDQQTRFQFLDKVRVRSLSGVRRFFVNRSRRQMMGQVGTVALVEIGKYSQLPLYTVLFDSENSGCFFEDELDSVA